MINEKSSHKFFNQVKLYIYIYIAARDAIFLKVKIDRAIKSDNLFFISARTEIDILIFKVQKGVKSILVISKPFRRILFRHAMYGKGSWHFNQIRFESRIGLSYSAERTTARSPRRRGNSKYLYV